jgi:hypothetical protein
VIEDKNFDNTFFIVERVWLLVKIIRNTGVMVPGTAGSTVLCSV